MIQSILFIKGKHADEPVACADRLLAYADILRIDKEDVRTGEIDPHTHSVFTCAAPDRLAGWVPASIFRTSSEGARDYANRWQPSGYKHG